MAKYTINDTTLVAIADAIRAKSGTTGGIDPANMAALIAAIEAGGGGASIGDWTIQSGTFTPSEDITSAYTIGLDEGLVIAASSGRSIAAFWLDNPPGVTISNSAWVVSAYFDNVFSETIGVISNGFASYTDAYGRVSKSTTLSNCIKHETWVLKIPCTTSRMLIAGNVYRWIALTRKWQ